MGGVEGRGSGVLSFPFPKIKPGHGLREFVRTRLGISIQAGNWLCGFVEPGNFFLAVHLLASLMESQRQEVLTSFYM